MSSRPPPLEAVAAGASSGVEVLIGTNSDEPAPLFVPDRFDLLVENRPCGCRPPRCMFTSRMRSQLIAWPCREHRQVMMPTGSTASPPSGLPRQAGYRVDTFQYEVAWASPRFDGRLGGCHSLEIGFVVDNLDPACREVRARIR